MALSRCDYILDCSHERPTLARHGGRTLESRVLVSARRLRELKAAPEGVEIEVIEPAELRRAVVDHLESALRKYR